ncbi:hypothetical protein B0H13DRAFT_2335597 [Mycena leptocephala]|nr:hypothetical protein B0H13DRAFT_2335597 [Mycena leptocephala]
MPQLLTHVLQRSSVRMNERAILRRNQAQSQGQDNDRIALLTPPLTQRTSRPRSSKRDTAKGQILGKPPRRLQRHHALLSIPGPSAGDSRSHSPSRGILPGRPIVIDLEDNDDAPRLILPRPRPFVRNLVVWGLPLSPPSSAITLPRRHARTWSVILNCWRSHFHTATGSPKGSNTTNYSGSLTAPTGRGIPTRLRPYSSDARSLPASPMLDASAPTSYTNFMDMLRVCVVAAAISLCPPSTRTFWSVAMTMCAGTTHHTRKSHASKPSRTGNTCVPALCRWSPPRPPTLSALPGIRLPHGARHRAVVRLGLVPCPDCCIIRISPTATAIAAVTSDPEIPPSCCEHRHGRTNRPYCTQLPPLPPFSNKPLHPDNCHGGLQLSEGFLATAGAPHHALCTALRNLSTCDRAIPRPGRGYTVPPTRARVSGDVPTSSDEEVGRTSSPGAANSSAADNSSDDAEYYSTSSTSSSGSSNRDLEAKAALWCEYLQHPADVVSRFAPIAPVSPAGGSASNLEAWPTICNSDGSPQGAPTRASEPLVRSQTGEEAGAEADDEDEVEIN